MQRKRIQARGRVQGVFFRDSTAREAKRRGVSGWVRNLADGSVEAVFEGPLAEIEAMIAFVNEGPGAAEVKEVRVSDEDPEGLSAFSVRS